MSQPEKLSIPCWENASLPAYIGKRSLEQYHYRKLNSENELRLLCVRQSADCCSFEIVHHNSSESLDYEAVSYVWGNLERTQTLLLAGDVTVPITSSLSTALPYLAARSRTGYLWIDQLCINQGDVGERNTEVPKMGTIYKSATRVIAWLGEDDSETRLIQEIIGIAGEVPKKPGTSQYYKRLDPEVAEHVSSLFSVHPGQDFHLRALSHFMDNPWFRRTWCFQEAILGKSLSFLAGKFELGDGLEPLFVAIVVLKARSDKTEEYRQIRFNKSILPLDTMFFERRRIHLRNRHTPFHVLLSDMGGYCEATDPRDNLYGFLGLQTKPNIFLEANYSLTVEETFIQSSRAIITGTRSLDIFNAIRLSRSGKYELPSWVPDWSSPSRATSIITAWDHSESNPFAASSGRHYSPPQSQEPSLALSVRGRSIGCLTYLAQLQEPFDEMPHFEQVKHHIPLDTYTEQMQRDCPLLTNVTRERLLKVILVDCAADTERVRLDIKDLLHRYDILCSDDDRSKLPRSTFDAYIMDLFELSHPARTRRIFCTMDGKLGLGPRNSEINDEVVIIHGSRMPLVLRPTGTGEHWLVGRCYLEGVMSGEACTWPEDEADEFILV